MMEQANTNSDTVREKHTRLEIEGEHAELILHTPNEKINKLSRQAFEELQEHLAILKNKANDIKTLLIWSDKPGMFLAGADIQEIQSIQSQEEGLRVSEQVQDIFQELEDLPQTTMVAMDGMCLGGGLELALACDYRVCSDHSEVKLALPEVQLGILPGAGGTQRLPQAVGLVEALKLMTTGSSVEARKARKIKLIDDIMPSERMLEICRQKLRDGSFRKYDQRLPLNVRIFQTALLRKMVFRQTRKQILNKTQGFYPAPLKIVDVVEKTFGKPIKEGLFKEAEAFAELAVTKECRNLISLFFDSEQLKKERGVSGMEAADFKPKKLKRFGVLGAGIMGGGVAAVAAKKGLEVRIKDVAHESMLTALKTARDLFERDYKRKRIDLPEFRKRIYRVSPTLQYVGFEHCEAVVEAVVEKMEVKKQVIQELEKVLSEEAIIASNTSSLSIGEMASASKNPGRVVGMHFFNPVPKMPLVEVVRSEQTSPETVVQTVALGRQIGKTVIVVKDRPGFLINRILMPYLIECFHLRQEGYSITQIDQAAVNFGMPMGPFRLLDEVGFDTAAKVADTIAAGYPHLKVLPTIHELVSKGYLGRKNAKGFYSYDKKGKETKLRPEFQMAAMEAAEGSIQDRLILPMLAEAVMALDEGIVKTARELDLGLIYGIGFPPFYGGLLRWASQEGLRNIVDRLNVIHNATKGRLVVPKALVEKAQSGQDFYPNHDSQAA